MATTYAYLVDPNKQYMTKSGTINVNGTLRVYDAATDDIVITYKDFNGTENEASINLDNNGRAIVIADSSRAYRLEVYDRYGSLQWTVSPLWCLAAGGGVNVHTTRVISTDGSIDVDQIDVGSTTTYDIGLAPSDSMEYLEWVKCKDENISNGTWYPTYVEGTMETSAGEGLQVGESRFYHITSTLKVDPTGNGINYDTLSVRLMFNDGDEEHELIRRDFDIDNSVNDPTLCEFSYDFACPADGFIYIKVDGVNHFTQVDSELQVHRIYSGINAVPGSCAAKPWVSEYFEEKSSMSAYIPFSGLDYNQGGRITGISGSAIYAALDSSTVSAIASSYAESAISSISGWSADFSSISSKIDWSSSGVFQPSGNYQTAGDYAFNSSLSAKADQSAFEQCCDEVHSALDEKIDKSASGKFQPSGQYVYESSYSSFSSEVTNNISSISSTVSGLTGQYIEQSASSMFQPSGNYASASDLSSYVPFSGIEGEGGRVTGISGSAIKGHEYTGINPVVVNNTADTISVEHRTLCVDSTMTAYTTGDSAVIGVNVAGLDISGKVDSSAIGTYDYYGTALVTTLSGSGFYAERANRANEDISGRPLTELAAESSLSSKQDTLTFGYDDDKISAINGSALAGQGGGGGLVTAIGTSESGITSINNSGLVDTAALHSADYSSLYVQEPLYISASGDSSYIGISGDVGGVDSATCSAIASAYAESAASGKLDTTAQVVTATASASSVDFGYTSYYMGGINGLNLSANKAVSATHADQANEALSATNWLGESSKLDSSASSSFYTTANESGFVDSAYVESQVSSKQDTLTFDWDADSAISSINGSALAGQGGAQVVTSITTGGYGVREINGMVINASHMVLGAEAAYNTSNIVKLGNSDYGAGVFLTGNFGSAYYKVNELQLNRNGTGFIGFNIGGAGSQITATSNAGGKFSAGGTGGNRSYFTAFNASASASVEVTGSTAMINIADTGYTSTIYPSSIPYWNGKADSSALSSYVPYSSLEYNTASAISGINGSALAAGSTYSAGEGIDITDDVISVEAPVDIVAGPGIVIDNPDGNTLRVSTDENYEVELYYSPINHNVATNAEFAMSESIWNFSKVLITFDNMEFENRTCTMLIDLAVADTGTYFTTPYCNGDAPGTLNICWASFNINAAGNIKYLNRGLIFGTWTAPAFTTGTSRGYRVKRVVGIHRLANN